MTEPATESGTILSVAQVTLGDELAAAAAAGATTLTVVDATDYDATNGGTFGLNGATYQYTVTDADGGVLTFTPALAAAAAQGDRVDVWDTVNNTAAVKYEADVDLPGDLDNADSVPARLAQALVPQFTHKLGLRDPGTGETCTLQRIAGEWVVTDVDGGVAQVDGGALAPATVPQSSLGFTLPSGNKVTIGSTAPTSPAVNDLWLDATSGYQIKQWNGTAWVAYQLGVGAVAFDARALGGVKVTFAATAPSSPLTGDLWYDSSNGYKLNQWSGTAWVAVQFGTNAIANGAITAGKVSFVAHDIGGITATFAATAPASPVTGDLWYDTSNGYKLNQWNGTAWVAVQYGTNAIAAGAITAALIASHTITAAQIAAGTITATEIAANTITAAQIAANTVTAAQIAADTITAAQIAAGTITATQLAANSVTASQIAAGAVTAAKIAAGTIVAGIVDATTITGAQFVATGTAGEILVYNGTPAAGNLVLAISGSAGSDSFGNSFRSGLSVGDATTAQLVLQVLNGAGSLNFHTSNANFNEDAAITQGILGNGGPTDRATLTMKPAGNSNKINFNPQIDLESWSVDGTTLEAVLALGCPAANWLTVAASGSTFNTDLTVNGAVKVGNGAKGKYYSSRVDFTQTVTSGTLTAVGYTSATITSERTDYGTCWSNASGVLTFTAPVAGDYDFSLAFQNPSGSTLAKVIIKDGTGANLTGNASTTAVTPVSCAMVAYSMAAGDKLTFNVQAAATSLTGRLTVARRL